ncbi:MAG: hypothetical protein MZW92_44790 [Comamonadaceae bacterium]|nr:hypothetical protein [Comamonadaceae bacterium]
MVGRPTRCRGSAHPGRRAGPGVHPRLHRRVRRCVANADHVLDGLMRSWRARRFPRARRAIPRRTRRAGHQELSPDDVQALPRDLSRRAGHRSSSTSSSTAGGTCSRCWRGGCWAVGRIHWRGVGRPTVAAQASGTTGLGRGQPQVQSIYALDIPVTEYATCTGSRRAP